MASNLGQHSNVRIGKDGKIYVGDDPTPDPTPDPPSPKPSNSDIGWFGRLVIAIIVFAVLVWGGVIRLDSSTPLIGFLFNDSVAVIEGKWRGWDAYGDVHHVIKGDQDEIYLHLDSSNTYNYSPINTLTVSSRGRFDIPSYHTDSAGRGQAFSIGGVTYLLYDNDKDTLVHCDIDGTGLNKARSLHRE